MSYERLSAPDAAFLYLESPNEPQHVGSLSILEGEPLRDHTGQIRFEEIRDHVASRLDRVPRLRQKVMDVPLRQGRPIWVDDDHFDIDFHVRLTSLPRPGDERQLTTLMSRLQSIPIDRNRPLWELWIVDGLADDRVAMIIKTHHAMGDGIANVDMVLALVDVEPVPISPEARSDWTPRPAPSANQLLMDSMREQINRPFDMARSFAQLAREPGVLAEAVGNLVRTAGELAEVPDPAPWNVPVSMHRRWVHADLPMSVVRDVRENRDATLNDVVLAACAGALRRFLLERDSDDPHRSLTALMPVSTRADDQHDDTLGNLVSLAKIELPLDCEDPLERLETIHQRSEEVKGSGVIDGAEMLMKMTDGIPMLAPEITRLVTSRMPMNLVITNVPGPPVPLYLCGARIERCYPYVEVLDNAGLTIAVVSYDDQLCFGVTADRDVLPDVELITDGIEKEFQLLAEQVVR